MAKLKHILEIERGVRAMNRDIQIDYRDGTKGHPVLIVRKGGRKGVFALSCSPRKPDECVRMTLKKIQRYFETTHDHRPTDPQHARDAGQGQQRHQQEVARSR